MPKNPNATPPRQFRFGPETMAILDSLVNAFNISRTDVIKIALVNLKNRLSTGDLEAKLIETMHATTKKNPKKKKEAC